MAMTRILSCSRFIISVVALPFLLVACDDKQVEEAKELVRPAKIVTVGDLLSQAVREFPGEVEASDKAEQAFRVSGELIKLPAKAGMKIKKGQLLARLDPKDYKLKLDDRKAKYDLAKVQYERADKLIEQKLIPIADFDKAKSRMLTSKSDLALAQADYDYTFLRAPFAGVVSRVLVDNHENVLAKQTILHVQSVDKIDISIQLPESFFALIRDKRDKKARSIVTFDTHPKYRYTDAVLKELDTEADPKTNTYRAKITMDAPTEFRAFSGMTVTVKVDFSDILRDRGDKIVVPAVAVFAAEDKPVNDKERYVWLLDLDSMRVKRSAVTVGKLHNNGIEITSGLKAGDQIIAAGVHFLTESQQVRPIVRERGL